MGSGMETREGSMPEPGQALRAGDWARIFAALSGAVAPDRSEPRAGVVLASQLETRLRFNALAAVQVWQVRLVYGGAAGVLAAHDAEAELFYWEEDDEWEAVGLVWRPEPPDA